MLKGYVLIVAYVASYLYRFDVFSEQRKEDVENIYNIRIELLSRLEAGEKSAIEWAKMAGKNQRQIEKLADEIENIKCCGNCDSTESQLSRWQKIKIVIFGVKFIYNSNDGAISGYSYKGVFYITKWEWRDSKW